MHRGRLRQLRFGHGLIEVQKDTGEIVPGGELSLPPVPGLVDEGGIVEQAVDCTRIVSKVREAVVEEGVEEPTLGGGGTAGEKAD